MNIKKELQEVKEKITCGDFSDYSMDDLLEQYCALRALAIFEDTHLHYLRPVDKKAKEIALDIAMRYYEIGQGDITRNIVDLKNNAESIYQWLIQTDPQP